MTPPGERKSVKSAKTPYQYMIPSFENTEIAFAYKSDADLKKARFLFKSMGNALLVKLGIWITPWAIRLKLPIRGIIRKTIFSQFVGGETLEQTAPVARKLRLIMCRRFWIMAWKAAITEKQDLMRHVRNLSV